jgi:hypothetical protein
MGNYGKKGSLWSLLVTVTHSLMRVIASGQPDEKGVESIHHPFLFFCPFKYNAPLFFILTHFWHRKPDFPERYM